MSRLWKDEGGFVVSFELILVATLLVIGIMVGLATLRNSVNAELAEVADAIMSISQGYQISGQTGCCSNVAAQGASDTPDSVDEISCEPAANPVSVNHVPCN